MPDTIQLGSKGPLVKRVQRVFARMLVWDPFGPITGNFDASLQTSVKQWQQGNGLVVDGIVGPKTWASLPPYQEGSGELQVGSTGPSVAWLQQCLIGKDIVIFFAGYKGQIDGIYGPLTEQAVKNLQTWASGNGGGQHIAVDGKIDDDDWFIWMTPGSAQQLRLEEACGLTNKIFP